MEKDDEEEGKNDDDDDDVDLVPLLVDEVGT